MLRAPFLAVLLAFAASAQTPIALEAGTLDPVRLLAAAAGGCAPAMPAFIRTWCPAPEALKTSKSARFTHQVKVLAQRQLAPGVLELTVEPVEYGKGMMLFLGPPQVSCDQARCFPASREQLVVHLAGDVDPAAPVDAVTVSFAVKGLWRIRQWWGPKPAALRVSIPGPAPLEGVVLEPAAVEGR